MIWRVSATSRASRCRAFSCATGETVTAYVRGRWLTEAAFALADGAPDTLAVALQAGYGSHEASRAFRDQFGLTPAELRARGHLGGIALVGPLREDLAVSVHLSPPRLVSLGPLLIAGIGRRFACDDFAGIPALWQELQPHLGQIPGQKGDVTYGLVANTAAVSDSYFYLAGIEVSDIADLDSSFTGIRLPEQGARQRLSADMPDERRYNAAHRVLRAGQRQCDHSRRMGHVRAMADAELAHGKDRGGCLCGGVRFAATGPPKSVFWCHCRSCRKHSGAPVSVFVGFDDSAFVVTTGEIATFNSSPGTVRGFCRKCGSTLTCEVAALPGEAHFHIGAFDGSSTDSSCRKGNAQMSTRDGLIDPWRSFGDDAASRVETQYDTKVDPSKGADGGCMWALYDGALSGLYGHGWAEAFRKEVYKTSLKPGKSNNVDLVMELLQDKGKAHAPWSFQFRGSKWQCESPDKFKGKEIEDSMTESTRILLPSWFFFGVSVSAGYHSLIVAVEKKAAGSTVYWLDQFTRAFDKQRRRSYATATVDVTNRLDQTITNVGTNRTRVWPLYK